MADLGFQLSSFRLLLSVSISIALLCQLVRCQSQVKEGRIRLDPGPLEGLVEVFSEEQWGTISNENLDDNIPTLICRELGFNGPADKMGGTVYKGPLNSPVWIVECPESESTSSISECDVTKSESPLEESIVDSLFEMFDHSNDLGIICRDPPDVGPRFFIIDIILFVVTILFIIFFAFMAYRFSKKRKSEARDDRRDPPSNPDQVDEETELSGSGRGGAPHEYERHMPEAHPLHDLKGAESTTYLTVP